MEMKERIMDNKELEEAEKFTGLWRAPSFLGNESVYFKHKLIFEGKGFQDARAYILLHYDLFKLESNNTTGKKVKVKRLKKKQAPEVN